MRVHGIKFLMTGGDSTVKLLLSEDISPHKISLLILISFYASGEIPEFYVGAILTLLVKYLDNELVSNSKEELVVLPDINDICKGIEKSVSNRCSSADYDDGGKDGEATKELQLKLLQELWNITSVQGLDMLITQSFSHITSSLSLYQVKSDNVLRRSISPKSILGAFVRKIVTTFKLLHFDEVSLLFQALIDYREDSRRLFHSLGGRINYAADNEDVSENAEIYRAHPLGTPRKSIVDTDSLNESDRKLFENLESRLAVNFNINITRASDNKGYKLVSLPKTDIQLLLDKQIGLLETFGTETPKALRDVMKLMTNPSSNTSLIQNTSFNNLPSYYYIQYLERLYDLDYHGAFHSLHQYFDYMVSNNSKYFYHFALISCASLHHYFGEDEKALDSIQEAISVARENKDNSTLTYILCWLFNFMRNKPDLWGQQTFYHNNNVLHLLNFLIRVSQTVSLQLYAVSYQFETLSMMDQGGPQFKYFEALLKATYISLTDGTISFVKSAEVASTVWSRVGNPYLSAMYAEMALNLSNESGNMSNELSLLIRRAYLSYDKGDIEETCRLLESIKTFPCRNLSVFKSLNLRRLLISAKIELKRRRYRFAEKLVERMMGESIQELELKYEIAYMDAEVQLSLGNFSRSLQKISNHLSQIEALHSKIQINLHTTIRLNLLKCKIFNDSGSHGKAISLAIQQIQNAKKAGFRSLTVEGFTIFVSILNNMGKFTSAYRLITSIMTETLALNNLEFISCIKYEFARTCLYLCLTEGNDSEGLILSQKELFKRFLSFLNSSISGFKQLQDIANLEKCFELENIMAKHKQLEELRTHATKSLEKLNIKAIREVNRGFS